MTKRIKNKKNNSKTEISPLQSVQFLEDMRKLSSNTNEPTIPISLRVPANLLRAVKTRAKIDGKRYQSLIIEFIRMGLDK